MKSVLSYMGGKSRLAATITERIPTDHRTYCEPFCGACWVLFAKPESRKEVINDIDSELVTFWRVIQNHRDEFMRYYKYAVVGREIFQIEQRKRPDTLTDIQRAARYFYLQKLGFGGRTTGRTYGYAKQGRPGLNLFTMEDQLIDVERRLKGVEIENLDSCDCITRYDHPDTLFFIDPPYYNTAGYVVPFKEPDYIRLRDTLAPLKGRFLLSLNDCVQVRSIFKSYKFTEMTLKYSVAVSSKSRAKTRREVLIQNF